MDYIGLIRCAIDNEKYSDYVVAAKMGVERGYRPQKKLPIILNVVAVKFLFFFVLLLGNFLKFFRSAFCVRKVYPDSKAVYILSSNKSVVLFGDKMEGACRIEMRTRDYCSYLSVYGKFLCFCRAQLFVLSSFKNVSDVYYFHDVFDVLCFHRFLSFSSFDTVYFTNHYDRWAVVVDSLRIKDKIQYQHGIVSNEFDPPTKLKSISSVVCTDEESVVVWKKNICINKMCEYSIEPMRLRFNSWPEGESILIISNPLYVEEERKLIDALIEVSNGFSLLYKPHPVYKYDLKGVSKSLIIVKPHEYPVCNVCITKGSTLGREYEGSGVKVIWWGDSIGCNDIVEKALDEINVSESKELFRSL